MFEQTKSRTLKWSTAGIAAFAAASALAGPAQARPVVPEVPRAQLPSAPATCTVSVPVRFDRTRRMRQYGESTTACAGQIGERVIRATGALGRIVSGRVNVAQHTCALQLGTGRISVGVPLLPQPHAPSSALAKIQWRASQAAAASPLAGTATIGRRVLSLGGSVAFRAEDPSKVGCDGRLQPGTIVFEVTLSPRPEGMPHS